MDIICFSHLRWNFVYQRPQHLMSRMAKHFRVFFVEEPFFDSGSAYLDSRQEDESVWIIVPHLPEGLAEDQAGEKVDALLNEFFSELKLKSFIVWYYTPMAFRPQSVFDADLVIYDCMDELSAFRFAPASLKEKERQLMERADLVFTGGYSLYQAKKSNHLNIHLFPSSIDARHFQLARTLMHDMPDQHHIGFPRIGFFGVIDERMDIELLNELAVKRPQWHFVLIGPVVKIDAATLPQHRNIHYLGQKTYNELPRYIAHWDVAMMPFAINESTRYISPTKTPEYLAAGKPVVSTRIHDVVQSYGDTEFVYFGSTANEFIEGVALALSVDDKIKWLKDVDKLLSMNSWDITCDKMIKLIYSTLPKQKHQRKETGHV
jgi:glycosyltransferase involved in cell wall biosynthesis